MLVAASRFRVANGMIEEVRQAFLERPRLVESARGFLGMEVFDDSADRSIFYLLTRWTDADAFREWHRSDAHRASHAGIPKGLKLDATFTRVLTMQRLACTDAGPTAHEIVSDHAPLITRFLTGARSAHLIVADGDGHLLYCNPAVEQRIGRTMQEIAGAHISQLMTAADALLLEERIASRERGADDGVLINFVNSAFAPYTLRCQVDVQPNTIVIIGEPEDGREHLQDEMVTLNNELAVLSRESVRKSRELAATLARLEEAQASLQQLHQSLAETYRELDTSYWHLKKIQEVLPVCIDCGKVKGEAKWESVIDYLKAHSLFLSHGYCPECADRALADSGE